MAGVLHFIGVRNAFAESNLAQQAEDDVVHSALAGACNQQAWRAVKCYSGDPVSITRSARR